MLDFLNSERKENPDMDKELKKPENSKILKLLEEKIRF